MPPYRRIVTRFKTALEASNPVAMEFDTPEAMKKYLEDHPGADKSNHSVKKPDTTKPKARPSPEDVAQAEKKTDAAGRAWDSYRRKPKEEQDPEVLKKLEKEHGEAFQNHIDLRSKSIEETPEERAQNTKDYKSGQPAADALRKKLDKQDKDYLRKHPHQR